MSLANACKGSAREAPNESHWASLAHEGVGRRYYWHVLVKYCMPRRGYRCDMAALWRTMLDTLTDGTKSSQILSRRRLTAFVSLWAMAKSETGCMNC